VSDAIRAKVIRLVNAKVDELAREPDTAIRHVSPIRTEITVKDAEGRRRRFTLQLVTHQGPG
jgi:hypothetical protein